jgi:hypothetical protein
VEKHPAASDHPPASKAPATLSPTSAEPPSARTRPLGRDEHDQGSVAFEGDPAAPAQKQPALDPKLADILGRKADAAVAANDLRASPDPAEVQAAIARVRPALDACIVDALAGPDASALAGRKSGLLLLVTPSTGRTEGALEDAELASTPLGACLKRAASKVSIPPFRGEPLAVRVPIVLGAAR